MTDETGDLRDQNGALRAQLRALTLQAEELFSRVQRLVDVHATALSALRRSADHLEKLVRLARLR